MSKHTKAPWMVDVFDPSLIVDSHTHPVIDIQFQYKYFSDKSDEEIANVHRIVACVNACEGMVNQDLERIADKIAELKAADAWRMSLLQGVVENIRALETPSQEAGCND